MNCNNCIETLSAFADGELNAGENAEVSAHLKKCADCSELYEQLKTLSALAKELEQPVPDEFRARWKGALEEQQKPLGLNMRAFGTVAAAVLVVALAVGLYPAFAAPKNASSAAEVDIVAGVVPFYENADEAAESAEAAPDAAEPETPVMLEAAAKADIAEFAEEEIAPDAALPQSDATEGQNAAAADLAVETDSTEEANFAQAEAAAAPKLRAVPAQENGTGTQTTGAAQTTDAAQTTGDTGGDELFAAQAASMLEASGQANAGGVLEDGAYSVDHAAQVSQEQWLEQAAQGRPLDFTGRITIFTNGADIETVRADWAALLKKYGYTGIVHMYVEDADKLTQEMNALGYDMFYNATYTDMPFEVVILEESAR